MKWLAYFGVILAGTWKAYYIDGDYALVIHSDRLAQW